MQHLSYDLSTTSPTSPAQSPRVWQRWDLYVSALQLLIAHVVGSQRGQELGKAGMIGSIVGLVAVFFARRS